MGMLKNKRQSVNLDITELPKIAAKGGHIEFWGLKTQCENSMVISSGLLSIFTFPIWWRPYCNSIK